jgi:hypothetical protein
MIVVTVFDWIESVDAISLCSMDMMEFGDMSMPGTKIVL